MSSQEEPQRISTVFLEMSFSEKNQPVDVHGAILELADGIPPPVIPPSPDNRISTVFLEAALSSPNQPVDIEVNSIELAYTSSRMTSEADVTVLEVADGVITPRDMTPNNRVSSVHLECGITGRNIPFDIHSTVVEVAHRPNIYSPNSNVQLIY